MATASLGSRVGAEGELYSKLVWLRVVDSNAMHERWLHWVKLLYEVEQDDDVGCSTDRGKAPPRWQQKRWQDNNAVRGSLVDQRVDVGVASHQVTKFSKCGTGTYTSAHIAITLWKNHDRTRLHARGRRWQRPAYWRKEGAARGKGTAPTGLLARVKWGSADEGDPAGEPARRRNKVRVFYANAIKKVNA
uniref:Uncharacterized protein n=1 Tax=Oryza brachyantha TaxID=4533 RepID=J3N1H7_ORYBR